MLAVSRDDQNLDCVKLLLQAKADFTTKDSYGNSVIHLAAMNGNNKILDYLSKNLKINVFERNKVGDTALSVCTALKNSEGVKILEQVRKEYDTTAKTADELLDELTKEEEHDEEAKAKRRQKKWRNKINRIAKAENIAPEIVEKRLNEEEEKKKADEILKKKEEAEREARAEVEE